MSLPDYFEVAESHASYRPVAKVFFAEAIRLVVGAVEFCVKNRIPKLLVNCTQLTGFDSLRTLDRYHLAQSVAFAAQSSVKIAVVARAELIDPERFGITVARNRGLDVNIFTAEPEALQWLLTPCRAALSSHPDSSPRSGP